MTLLVNIWNDTAVLGVTGPHFSPLFSFRNDPNCWWRDGFQVRQWEPGTLLDLLKATSVKALSTSSLQKLLNLHWLRLTHRLLKLEFNDSSASSLKSMVLEGCVSCVYNDHIPDMSTHWRSCEISSNNRFFLMKNAFYLAKSTSQSNGDLKGNIASVRRRDPIWWQGLNNQRQVHQTLQTASVSQCAWPFPLCGGFSCITFWSTTWETSLWRRSREAFLHSSAELKRNIFKALDPSTQILKII